MNFDTAAFYWIKEHLQSLEVDYWVQILNDKNIYLIPIITILTALL
ncbi:MAG: hypothetical protein GWM98_21500, partial [Nitrospinaceae bacterium]|nr:hypothetical protein [Nitrospinaceae bacterium]NIS87425.1 hypothetical protein [Nitrospinaceae bacterium]NIU46464.1 hypothetical protein [Nitrospinaceae bacterium]NIU98658.1 hypothetical protein [Nitrospinaceae bacterium]NIW08022.1 hypothetical protein [Nitrospinaceae bacterium]